MAPLTEDERQVPKRGMDMSCEGKNVMQQKVLSMTVDVYKCRGTPKERWIYCVKDDMGKE